MYNRWASQDELYHYGVLGMKWGVHKVRASNKAIERADKDQTMAVLAAQTGQLSSQQVNQMYNIANKRRAEAEQRKAAASSKLISKSSRKLEKINAKYEKRQAKADKQFDKAERKAESLFTSKRAADKAFRKASKSQYKANRVAQRGKRWYERMEKSYKSAGLEMSKRNQEIGKELIRQVRANSRAMYAASYAGGR